MVCERAKKSFCAACDLVSLTKADSTNACCQPWPRCCATIVLDSRTTFLGIVTVSLAEFAQGQVENSLAINTKSQL